MKSSVKKILVVYPASSHPAHNGSRSILLDYTSYLKSLGHDVFFMCVSDSVSPEEVKLMQNYWQDNLLIYKPPYYKLCKRFYKFLRRYILLTHEYRVDDWFPIGLGKAISKYQKLYNFDIVWVNYIWLSKLFNVLEQVKKVLYVHDVFTNRFKRTGVDWFSTTKLEEQKALNRSDYIAVLQDEEASFLQTLTTKPVLSVFGKFDIRQSTIVRSKNVLFFGSSNNHNIEAITWFIENVLGMIKSFDSSINLIIGGSICNALGKYSNVVSLIGRIEEIESFYALGNITINPVFHGTGLKIKTFEALAHGKLLVTHPHNVIGVPYKNEIPVLIAESAKEYCDLILRNISNYSFFEDNLIATRIYMEKFNSLFEKSFNTILTS
ncbi:glycosyltransferase [Flectobacillus rivi]|uniref:Glycosyltransferase n=1 Tax=Flectobacillus rivi TaxID=2984209 RepID=A0ABT6YWV4_9BACT|nr:glycosyltransferase [Flectobacillus rivi]MDI9873361.1 glycosyltransferase [Flectobacillus rivi]